MHYACHASSHSPGTVHEGMHSGPGAHPYPLQLHQSTHLTHLLGGPQFAWGPVSLPLNHSSEVSEAEVPAGRMVRGTWHPSPTFRGTVILIPPYPEGGPTILQKWPGHEQRRQSLSESDGGHTCQLQNSHSHVINVLASLSNSYLGLQQGGQGREPSPVLCHITA